MFPVVAKQVTALLAVLLWLCAAQLPSNAANAATVSLSDSVQPFYDVMEKFLDFMQPSDQSNLLGTILTALLNSSTTGKTDNSSQLYDWRLTAKGYWDSMKGYIILICIGLLLILLVPLVGLITCCCRCCCHKCGGKGRKMERRGSACRRGFYGVLLILLTTAMTLAVVLAFISNQLVHQQLDYTQGDTLVANISGSLADIADLLYEIPVRAKDNSGAAVATLVAAVVPATNASMVKLREILGTSSKADTSLGTAMAATQQLGLATNYSGSYVGLYSNYANSLDDLKAMLTFLKANLTGVDSNCPFNAIQSDCDLIARQLPGLTVTQTAGNTGLQNVTQLNALLKTIDNDKLISNLTSMQIALDNVTNVAMAYVRNYTVSVRNSLNSTSELNKIWASVERLFVTLGGLIGNSTFSVNSSVVDPFTQAKKSLEVVVYSFDLIRYAAYLAIASLASLVILLWFTGVIYGFCGEPPYEDARCCNRGVGANLLMAGTVISFITYSLLLFVVMALFLTGGLADTEVCRYLTGRAGSSGYKHLDSSLNQILQTASPELSKYSLNLVSGLLGGCSTGNASITAALNIQGLVQASDINILIDQFVRQANALLQSRHSDLISGIVFNLNVSSLESVASTAAAQSLTPFITELQKQTIQGSDRVFAAIQNISLSASKTQDKTRFVALFAYLNSTVGAADLLVQSQLSSINGFRTSLMQLNRTVAGVTAMLESSHISIQTPLTVELAINEATTNLSAQLEGTVTDTVARVISAAADCLAVNKILTTLVRAPCVTFLRPFNGFWAGMGFFLLCLLPCLLLTVRLANLYRKTHKHQKESYIDGDYKNPTYQQFYRISTARYYK